DDSLADLDIRLRARHGEERPLEGGAAAAEKHQLAVASLARPEIETGRRRDGERQLDRAMPAQEVENVRQALAKRAGEAREKSVRVPELGDPGTLPAAKGFLAARDRSPHVALEDDRAPATAGEQDCGGKTREAAADDDGAAPARGGGSAAAKLSRAAHGAALRL